MKGSLRLIFTLSFATLLCFGCRKKAEESGTTATPGPGSGTPETEASRSSEPSHGAGTVATSGGASLPGQASNTVPADLLADDAAYEAWFKKYGLDLNDPKMLDSDADHDGFTNKEEFLADTNPNDANSRPGVHASIRLKEFTEVRVPYTLRGVDGETARVEHSD